MHRTSIKPICFALAFVSLFFFGVTITSCSNDNEDVDGLWTPMEWETDVNINNGEIYAPFWGGTYVFNCKNYKHVWISEVTELTADGDKEFYPKDWENPDHSNMETSWGKISVEGGIVTIQLYPNDLSQYREYKVSVTAGDIFFTFTFIQNWDYPIGAWPLMEWETDVEMTEIKGIHYISVPAKGGSFVFSCTNYKKPWIGEIIQRSSDGNYKIYSPNTDDLRNLETLWGKVSVVNEKVTVKLYPNQSSQERRYDVYISAGDIWSPFFFTQEGDTEIDGDWETMTWKTDVPISENGEIEATAEGGTYFFTCINYKYVWIFDIEEITSDGKKEVYTVKADHNKLESQWGEVYTLDNKVTVFLYTNQTDEKRQYKVRVTTGNAFYTFTYDQEGK